MILVHTFSFALDSTPEMDVTGAFTLDCSDDITLDADGADITFADAGTNWLKFTNSAGSARIYNPVVDETISFMDTALSRTYMRIFK